MTKVICLSLLFLFCGSLRAADAPGFAYLGIVGPGPNEGMMGHAFVMTTPVEGDFLHAETFQFNVILEEGAAKSPLNFFGVGKRFIASKNPGNYYVQLYRRQGLPVVVFQLNLTPSEYQNFKRRLNEEYDRREKTPQYDYNLFKANCLTEVTKILNEVVSPEKRLQTVWTDGIFAAGFAGLSNKRLLANVPLFAVEELSNHPLVKGKPTIFQPFNVDLLKVDQYLHNLIADLAKECGWPEGKEKLIRWGSYREDIRVDDKFLTPFKQQVQKCSSTKAPAKYNQFLDFVLYAVSDFKVRVRLLDYYFEGGDEW